MTMSSRPDSAQAGLRPIRLLATADLDRTLLDALAMAGIEAVPLATGAFSAALAETSEPCAILWEHPVGRIAAAILAGTDPAAACHGWLSSSRTLLELYRRNRRRLLLVDARLLAADAPESLRAKLCESLGLPALPDPVAPAADPALHLARGLAALILPQIDTVRDCLDEVLTSSLALPPQAISSAELAVVSGNFGAFVTQAAAQVQEVAQLTERATLLGAQLDLQRKAAEQEQAALAARLQKAMLEADQALSRALEDLRDEARRRSSAEQQCDRLMRRVGDLTSKLEKTFASTSWRVTRPLRQIKLLVRGGERPVDMAMLDEKTTDPQTR